MEKRKRCFQAEVTQASDLNRIQLYYEFLEKNLGGMFLFKDYVGSTPNDLGLIKILK